jgi:hypothetical protein
LNQQGRNIDDGMRINSWQYFCGFVDEQELFEAPQLTCSAMQLMLNTRFHPL